MAQHTTGGKLGGVAALAISAAVLLIVGFFAWQIWGSSAPDAPKQARSNSASTKAVSSLTSNLGVTAEQSLVAKPNSSEEPDDDDLIVLKGRPGWSLCVDVPPGAEMWFKDISNRWVGTLPADGKVKDWGFRSTSGTDETVEYNFDRSPKCDTPVPTV